MCRSSRFLTLSLVGVLSACASNPPEEEPLVLFPLPPDPPRIQFLRSISKVQDVQGGPSALDRLLFGEREDPRGIQGAYGACVHEGRLYVCDLRQGLLLVVDLEAGEMKPAALNGRAALQKPTNLAFAPDGRLYIADVGRRQIVALGPELAYEAEYGPFGDESRPVDVDVRGDELYVVDAGSACVRVLDRSTGEELRAFGGDGPIAQRLRGPTNLALDAEGNAYVVDTIDCRIFAWGPDGSFLRHVSGPGDSPGFLARPKGIACFEDLLFVVDSAFENCQIFRTDGTPLMGFGGPGVGPGELYLPAGVWVGREGLESFRDRLAPDFEPEALVLVTCLYGERKLNAYALGRSSRFEYPEEPAPQAAPPPEEPTD